MKPPLTYYGGKTRIAENIAGLLPAHTHYVEPYGGSLSVLLAKTPSRMETVNDVDHDLMCFWQVLRNQPDELERLCALTPHSRAELTLANQPLDDLSDLERARRVWVRLTQGRAGTLRNTGWRHYIDGGTSSTSMPRYLTGYQSRLAPVAERLRQVSLECQPALNLITEYGSKRTNLLYVDPPYPTATGRIRNYKHEMAQEEDHQDLAEALHSCQATVVISGYTSDLYDGRFYPDWYRHELAASTTNATGDHSRIEVLWSNRPLENTDEPTLAFTDTFRDNQTGFCDETMRRCNGCATPIYQARTGRPRKYCTSACKTAHHRSRLRCSPDPSGTHRTIVVPGRN